MFALADLNLAIAKATEDFVTSARKPTDKYIFRIKKSPYVRPHTGTTIRQDK